MYFFKDANGKIVVVNRKKNADVFAFPKTLWKFDYLPESKVSNTCSLVSTLLKINRNQYLMPFEVQPILIATVGI